ncbi:methyltransferase-like protein 25 isoform X1 [Callorhinchus milii]|uniref:Methyltransferase domain-containing protein n=1 Tax=Callorhinchus milii TaxID=7868 RepID=V9KKZ0_CALMI|nr:methyltransferase-like protein 25 isoform X1 [Callorhinchus milii]
MLFSNDISLDLVRSKIKRLQEFLAIYLKIANVHTIDFYTEDIWNEYVALSPEAVLARYRCQDVGSKAEIASASVWDDCQKLADVTAYIRETQAHSLPYLGVCTTLDELLQELWGNKQRGTFLKTSQFMNTKKSHEVQVMSEVVACLAKHCNVQQVIDLGSGKGYLSSYLSMQYGLNVYGIDASSINTNGANERNRKLKRYWKVYQCQINPLGQSAGAENLRGKEMNTEGSCKEKVECTGHGDEGDNPPEMEPLGSPTQIPRLCVFTESEKGEFDGRSEMTGAIENEHSEDANAFLDLLPMSTMQIGSPPRQKKDLCEEEKEKRKNANLAAKAKRVKQTNLYSPLTQHVTATTDLSDIITDIEDSMMVGLHTCGDLASNTLRIFIAKPELKAVCSVGCCYHLLSEEYEEPADSNDCSQGSWGFPMSQYLRDSVWQCGRNARMSACLPLERVTVGQGLPSESLFYRAVLQVIFKEHYGNRKRHNVEQNTNSKHVGKIFSKSSGFVDYTRKSMQKLGMDDSKLSDSLIQGYYDIYRPRWKELEAFNRLKVTLAPCIEGLILLDRLCYLKEQESIAWSALVQLFDPIKSPRCYAVIGVKK